MSSNILFSNKVLLVEGDSDPIFIYELFRQLNRNQNVDVDLNMLGIMSFYNVHSLRFLLQKFKSEGKDTEVVVLVDGDQEGKTMLDRVKALCAKLSVKTVRLADGRSIEDYCLFEEEFLSAVSKTFENACVAEGKEIPKDLKDKISKSWEEHQSARANSEKKPKADATEKETKEEKAEARKERLTSGKWFKDAASVIIKDEPSKVVCALNYVELCRDLDSAEPQNGRLQDATSVCQEIANKLTIPKVRAETSIAPKKKT